jgi:outer membrane protein TolC
MIQKRGRLIIGLLSVGLLAGAGAWSAGNEKNLIGYQTYVDSIVSSLPEIKSNGINLLSQENALKSAKSLEDLKLTGSGNLSTANQITAPNGSDTYQINNTALSMGLSKKIVSTGTDVSLNAGYSRNSYEGFMNSSDTSVYTPSVGVTVKQPLLYNFLGKVDQYSEKSAAMKVDIEKVRLIETNKSTLNAYKKLYFEWVLTLQKIRDCEDSIANSRAQRDQVRRNYQSGLSEEDDYQKTVATLLEYEQKLESNRITLNYIVDQLSLYIKSSEQAPSEDDFNSLFSLSNAADFGYVDFSKTGSAKILDLTMRQLLYSKGVYENRLLPEFNVTGGVTQKGLATESSKAYSDLSYRDWNVGFNFTYSLGNNSAEASLKDVEIQLKSLEYTRDVTVNSYKKNLLRLADQARGTREILAKKTAYLNSLTRQLAVERRKYRQGRLNLFYVITTENSISAAKTDIFNLKYQLITYYIDYLDATN